MDQAVLWSKDRLDDRRLRSSHNQFESRQMDFESLALGQLNRSLYHKRLTAFYEKYFNPSVGEPVLSRERQVMREVLASAAPLLISLPREP